MVFLSVLGFPRNLVSIHFTTFNMISEQGIEKTLDMNIDGTQTETNHETAAAVAVAINVATMEKLLHQLRSRRTITITLRASRAA